MNQHYQINLFNVVFGSQKPVLVLPLVFALLLGNIAQADFAKGLSAYENKDYATALIKWMPLADAGDNQAQYNLGWMYKRGRGGRRKADTRAPRVRSAVFIITVRVLLVTNWLAPGGLHWRQGRAICGRVVNSST